MKRFLLLLLSCVMLVSCASCGEKKNAFFLEGDGYTDSETGIHYTALPMAYEPAAPSDERGVYTDKETEYTRTFYEIPELDSALWLCDDEYTVWYAGEGKIDPKTLTPTTLLVCWETAKSYEVARFTAGKDDAEIEQILTLWFTGETCEEPAGELTFSRRIKMASLELTNIYYCFDFCVWGEEACFYDRMEGRIVPVPAELAAVLRAR